jgi:hypothetical protein
MAIAVYLPNGVVSIMVRPSVRNKVQRLGRRFGLEPKSGDENGNQPVEKTA